MKRLQRLREMAAEQDQSKGLSKKLADLLDEARVVEQAIRAALWRKDLIESSRLQTKFDHIGTRAEELLHRIEGQS